MRPDSLLDVKNTGCFRTVFQNAALFAPCSLLLSFSDLAGVEVDIELAVSTSPVAVLIRNEMNG